VAGLDMAATELRATVLKRAICQQKKQPRLTLPTHGSDEGHAPPLLLRNTRRRRRRPVVHVMVAEDGGGDCWVRCFISVQFSARYQQRTPSR
jgi:hypothetical protein